MKNILVSIDFEKEATVLVGKAYQLAKAFGAKVWLVHVAAPDPVFVGYEVGPPSESEFRASELKMEQALIDSYVADLEQKGVKAEALLIPGYTVDRILAETQIQKIDLVIIGHHKHSLLYRALVGNTDSELVRKAKVPVLVVPLSYTVSTKSDPRQEEAYAD
jgi:nucleotide-binding universal stress UspA family protein